MIQKQHVAVAGFVFLVNLFFYRRFGTTAFTLLSFGFLACLYAILPVSVYYRKHPISAYLLGLLTAVPLILMQFRGSMVIQTGLSLTYLMLGGFAAYLVTSGKNGITSVTEALLAIPVVVFSHLTSLMKKALDLIDGGASDRYIPMKRAIPVVLGIILGLPAVSILLGLLTGADPIYAKTVEGFTRYLSFDRLFWRITGSAAAFLIVAPFVGIRINQAPDIPNTFPKELSDMVTAVIFMLAVVAGSFLIVQWPYIFVRVAYETDLTRFGVATYSEYVRRGFGELLTAGMFMYFASWAGYISERRHTPRRILPYIIQLTLLAELVIFIVSVMRRVLLYWQFHGLTLVRIYGGLFLTTILLLTVILILRHLFKKTPWVKTEIAVLLFMAFFTGTWNAENFLVHHHPPTVNTRIDYVYLSKLSPDGYDGWVESYVWAKDTIERAKNIPPAVLSEDDLRQLSYAGSITGTITRSYLKLTGIYADTNTRQSISDQLSKNYLSHLTNYRADVEYDLSLLEKDASASGRLKYLTATGTDIYTRNRILSQQLKSIESKLTGLTDINRSSWHPVNYYRFRTSYSFSYPNFSSGTCSNDTSASVTIWCMPEYYTYLETVKNELTAADRFYMWNAKTAGVYGKMIRDIPISELLHLQNDFIAIYREINRISGIADIPWDISTETLFLESY